MKSQQHLFLAFVIAVVAMAYASLRLRKHICVTFCSLLSKTNVSVFREFISSDYQKERVHIILPKKKKKMSIFNMKNVNKCSIRAFVSE